MTNLADRLNVYYSSSQYNNSAVQIEAQIDENLIYPLLKDASQFSVALVKSKIPLDTIPLTQSNIPLKLYELILRKGSATGYAYVPQQNAMTQSNYIWSSNGGIISISSYSNTGVLNLQGQVDFSEYVPFIKMFVVDDFSNLYVIGSQTELGLSTLFYVFSGILEGPTTVYYSDLTYTDLVCVSIDRNQVIYLASNNLPRGVEIYSNSNSETSVQLTLIKTITTDFNNAPLSNIATVCSDEITIIGFENNKIQLFNTLYTPISAPIVLNSIVSLGNQSAILHSQDSFTLVDSGILADVLYGLPLATPTTVTNLDTGTQVLQGQWQNCPSISLDTLTVFGAGSISRQFYFVNNNPTATPVLGHTSYLGDYTCSNLMNFWYASDILSGATILYSVNPDGSFSIIDTAFTSGGGAFASFDIDKTTGLLSGVAADGKLYISDQPILPNQVWGLPVGSAIGTIQTQAIGLGSTTNIITNLNTELTADTNNVLGVYQISPVYFLVVTAKYLTNITGNLTAYITDGINTFSTLVVNSAQMGGTTPVVCAYSNEFNILTFISSGGKVYLITVNVGTPSLSLNTLTSISLTQQNLKIYSITEVSGGFLYSSGQSYTFCSYNAGTTLLTIVSSQLWSQLATISSVQSIYQNPAFPLTAVIIASSLTTFQQNLFYVTFSTDYADVSLANGPFYSAYDVSPKFNVSGYQDGCSFIQGDNTGNKIVMPSNTVPGGLDWYYVDNVGYTISSLGTTNNNFQELVQWNGSTCTPTFFQISQGCTNLYTYTQNVTTNLTVGSISQMCMSSNSNTIFCVDNTNKTYEGHLIGNNVADFLEITTVPSTYTTISAFKATNYSSTLKNFSLSSQVPQGVDALGFVEVLGLTRNVITGEYLACTSDSTSNLLDYNSNLQNTNWTKTLTPPGCIFAKNSENLDAGPCPIYSYQILIDAVNIAFKLAFDRANANGAGFLTVPVLSMNFTTGICTLTYDSEYTNSLNGILTSTDGILFNGPLNNLLQFNSHPDTLLGSSFNLVYLSTGSTSTPQNASSITIFNKLDKILFNSTTIFVAQSFFGNNQTNNTVTDISIDTSTLISNTGQWLLYEPNFLRPFILSSNNQIDRVQLQVFYQYLDSTTYPLLINPGQGWNSKLDFIRRFAF